MEINSKTRTLKKLNINVVNIYVFYCEKNK